MFGPYSQIFSFSRCRWAQEFEFVTNFQNHCSRVELQVNFLVISKLLGISKHTVFASIYASTTSVCVLISHCLDKTWCCKFLKLLSIQMIFVSFYGFMINSEIKPNFLCLILIAFLFYKFYILASLPLGRLIYLFILLLCRNSLYILATNPLIMDYKSLPFISYSVIFFTSFIIFLMEKSLKYQWSQCQYFPLWFVHNIWLRNLNLPWCCKDIFL